MFHYKERNPLETIQIIEQFFNNRNLQIKKTLEYHSEIDTYSCQYGLFLNDQQILKANGKGITPELSKASCFGELYERFCAETFTTISNPFLSKDVRTKRYQLYNYNYKENEKILNINEFLSDTWTRKVINSILLNYQYIRKYFQFYFGTEQIYGLKYQNLDDNNDIQYKSFQFLHSIKKSNGLACGNTIEEALIQASSEIFERININKFFSEPQECYYYLNKNNLPLYIKNKIDAIESLGYDIKLYDLSYNFHMPVCMLYLYNKEANIFYVNFGAHPLFEVAAERCFTEIYQGIQTYKAPEYTMTPCSQINKNNISKTCLMHWMCCQPISDVLYEQLFSNIKKVNNYNNQIFLDNIENSNNLIKHINYISNLNNIKLYWTDLSLSKDIFTIQIVSNDTTDLIALSEYFKGFQTINVFTPLQNIYNQIDNIIKYNKQETFNKNYIEKNKILLDYTMTLCHPIQCIKHDSFKKIFLNFNSQDIFNIYHSKQYQNFIQCLI